jgi:hypothetical protein
MTLGIDQLPSYDFGVPSGKPTFCYGKSQLLAGKSTHKMGHVQ